jgi:hypothetical protein
MKDGRGEGELRNISRVYLRQADADVEDTIVVRCVRWARDGAGPVEHVLVADWGGGAGWERLVLEG